MPMWLTKINQHRQNTNKVSMSNYTENKQFVNDLKARIRGNEFEHAKRLINTLTDGKPGDTEHHQPCPCPGCESNDNGFRFNPTHGTFHCRKCGLNGDIFSLLQKVRGINFPAAIETVATDIGISLPTTTQPPTFKTQELTDTPLTRLVMKYRPEINIADYHRAGAVLCPQAIAIPMYNTAGTLSGYVRFMADGSKKNSKGAKSGIVGTNTRDALLSKHKAKTWIKTAGVSDYLVLSALINEAGLGNDYIAFTNGAGEGENPEKFDTLLRPALTDQSIAVIADNDTAGDTGATKWGEYFARFAKDVRIIHLPTEKSDCTIKDMRDFASTGGTLADVLHWVEQTEPLPKPKTITQTKDKIESTGVPLLDKFCKQLKKHTFRSAGDTITQMEFIVQAVDEIIQIAKARKLDVANKNGDFYCYNGRYWEKILPTSFHTFLQNACIKLGIPYDLSRYYKFQEKVREQFKDVANFPFVQNDGVIRINLKSGTLEFHEGQEPKTVPFDRRHGLCYQLNYDYDPDAWSPLYTQFIDRCIPDVELQLLLGEYMGYIFQNRLNFEKMLFLYGSGANGKSVWLAALTALLGKQNVTNHSLESITKRQEYRVLLAEGLVNVCAEAANNLHIDIFKKIASREPLECRKLYENPITITNYSRQVFATNVLPKTTESTEGFFRRFLLVPFDVFIPPEERNYRMNTVEFWEESGELPGILNQVILGLKRLLCNGHFTASDRADNTLEEYKQDSDSAASFMQDEGYVQDSMAKIALKELYVEYTVYCKARNRMAVTDKTFAKRLRSIGYNVVKGTGGINFVYAIKTITI